MGQKLAAAGDFIHARRRNLAITKGQAARMAGLTDGEWRDLADGLRPADDATLGGRAAPADRRPGSQAALRVIDASR